MDQNKQRDIASKGGQSVPAEERSFTKDRELAAEAGRKGGEHSHGGQQQSGGSSGQQAEAALANDGERASEEGRRLVSGKSRAPQVGRGFSFRTIKVAAPVDT
jgi:uncharacterized protein